MKTRRLFTVLLDAILASIHLQAKAMTYMNGGLFT